MSRSFVPVRLFEFVLESCRERSPCCPCPTLSLSLSAACVLSSMESDGRHCLKDMAWQSSSAMPTGQAGLLSARRPSVGCPLPQLLEVARARALRGQRQRLRARAQLPCCMAHASVVGVEEKLDAEPAISTPTKSEPSRTRASGALNLTALGARGHRFFHLATETSPTREGAFSSLLLACSRSALCALVSGPWSVGQSPVASRCRL